MGIAELIGLVVGVIAIVGSYFGAVIWFAHLTTITNILQHQHSDLAKSYSKADENMILTLNMLKRKIGRIEHYLAKNRDYQISHDENSDY